MTQTHRLLEGANVCILWSDVIEETGEAGEIWVQGYKTFFMLNSVEHKILNAHKYKNIKKFGL